MKNTFKWLVLLALLASSLPASSACRPQPERGHEDDEGEVLTLPPVAAADLGGGLLKVVATTSIIGDVVAQVGGPAIDLTILMEPGQDPHSYEPTPQEMATVSQAQVVFVNGWDLEETLVHDLEEIAERVPLVPISAGIVPLAFGGHEEEEEHGRQAADPHVWFDIANVELWVDNVARVLGDLDPAHAEMVQNNAEAYRAELRALAAYAEGRFERIPAENRVLVTNHDSLGYLARAYDLRVLGTVLPAASTVAEPSASDLAALIENMGTHKLCTLFTETTVSDKLAQTVAAELAGCGEVSVRKLYTGALGPAGSGAESYIEMYRTNVDTIVAGLQ